MWKITGSPDEEIDTAIGQAESLMRKKFNMFRQLIELYEDDQVVDAQRVLADNLEGFWTLTNMEVSDIDQRFE